MDNETIKRKLTEIESALLEIPATEELKEARNNLSVAVFWFDKHTEVINKKVRKHAGLEARR